MKGFKRSKIFFLISFISLLLFLFNACSAGKVSNLQGGIDSKTNKQESTSDTPEVEDVVLKVCCQDRYTKYVSMNDYPLIWQEFEKKTGIKVQFEAYPAADYNTIVGTRIAANKDMPDILAPVGNILNLYESKVLIDHAPLIEKVGVNAKKYFSENPDYAASLYSPSGGIPAIYGHVVLNYQYFPVAYMIRKEWVKKLNRELPKTIDDWYEALTLFKKNDINGNGDNNDEIPLSTDKWYYVLAFADAWDVHLLSTGGFFPNPDGKVTFEYMDPKLKDVLLWVKYLVILQERHL